MNSRRHTIRALVLAVFSPILALSLSAATADRTEPLTASGASAEVKQAVDPKGYRVTLDGGWTADFWFVRDLPTSDTNKDAAGALYPNLANGEFVGVVTFTKGTSDYRGQ